jgi:hypothetical protein
MRFAKQVMEATDLPAVRETDLRESCVLACEPTDEGELLRVTCTITGSSKESLWDGSESGAAALVDEAADETAGLVTNTRYYAWMRSRK